jgi:hypothetical protein
MGLYLWPWAIESEANFAGRPIDMPPFLHGICGVFESLFWLKWSVLNRYPIILGSTRIFTFCLIPIGYGYLTYFFVLDIVRVYIPMQELLDLGNIASVSIWCRVVSNKITTHVPTYLLILYAHRCQYLTGITIFDTHKWFFILLLIFIVDTMHSHIYESNIGSNAILCALLVALWVCMQRFLSILASRVNTQIKVLDWMPSIARWRALNSWNLVVTYLQTMSFPNNQDLA